MVVEADAAPVTPAVVVEEATAAVVVEAVELGTRVRTCITCGAPRPCTDVLFCSPCEPRPCQDCGFTDALNAAYLCSPCVWRSFCAAPPVALGDGETQAVVVEAVELGARFGTCILCCDLAPVSMSSFAPLTSPACVTAAASQERPSTSSTQPHCATRVLGGHLW